MPLPALAIPAGFAAARIGGGLLARYAAKRALSHAVKKGAQHAVKRGVSKKAAKKASKKVKDAAITAATIASGAFAADSVDDYLDQKGTSKPPKKTQSYSPGLGAIRRPMNPVAMPYSALSVGRAFMRSRQKKTYA